MELSNLVYAPGIRHRIAGISPSDRWQVTTIVSGGGKASTLYCSHRTISTDQKGLQLDEYPPPINEQNDSGK